MATGKVVAKTLKELEELQDAEADALDSDTTLATEAEGVNQEVVIDDSEIKTPKKPRKLMPSRKSAKIPCFEKPGVSLTIWSTYLTAIAPNSRRANL